tara:strand:- start:136 stop:276 length:141 start_codon:yes stop_codon:yes gene_type:complete
LRASFRQSVELGTLRYRSFGTTMEEAVAEASAQKKLVFANFVEWPG